jgi:uncharacterized protein (DUF1778 family)
MEGGKVAKMGRPKMENPKNKRIYLRLTEDEHTAITGYANRHNRTVTQTLVDAFNNMVEKEESEVKKD